MSLTNKVSSCKAWLMNQSWRQLSIHVYSLHSSKVGVWKWANRSGDESERDEQKRIKASKTFPKPSHPLMLLITLYSVDHLKITLIKCHGLFHSHSHVLISKRTESNNFCLRMSKDGWDSASLISMQSSKLYRTALCRLILGIKRQWSLIIPTNTIIKIGVWGEKWFPFQSRSVGRFNLQKMGSNFFNFI